MLSRLGVKLATYLLSYGNLSIEDSAKLTSLVLDKTGALPYQDIIGLNDEGIVTVNGMPLSMEDARQLHASATVAVNNKALKLVFEQIQYLAVVEATHKGRTLEQIYFGRTAIWSIQNIKKALDTLCGKESMV